MAAKSRQRKRPRAERKCPTCERLREQLRRENERLGGEMSDILLREQEKLRAQIVDKDRNYRAMAESELKMRNDLAAANSRIAELTEQLANVQADAVNCYSPQIVGLNETIEQLEIRIARLTAEKETLDADCAKIRGERDKTATERDASLILLQSPAGCFCGASGNVASMIRHYHDAHKGSSLGVGMAPTQKANTSQGACKSKPFWRRSFTELFRRGGA